MSAPKVRIQIVMAPDGSAVAAVDPAAGLTFEQAGSAIKQAAALLEAQGIPFQLEGDIQRHIPHYHDEVGNAVFDPTHSHPHSHTHA